ncbi:MAG: hypothetical protein JO138_11965 [Acidobacteriaceae bacterium]|nr:hypothetical protein [Acidobacteriaceae bacterium]
MAEANGGGRLDRLEALLDKMGHRLEQVATMGYLHDERLARIEANLEQMQEDFKQMQQDESRYRAEQRAREQRLDERVDKLVLSIVT